MTNRQLPDGWRWMKLGTISQINPPRTAKITRQDDELTTFVPMAAVDDQFGIIAEPQTRAFSQVKKGYTYFEEGDVLFAKITPCMENGKHAVARDLIDGFGFGTTEFHVLRPSDLLISEWIHCYLRQQTILERAISSFAGSVGQQRVPKDFLENLEIPVPLVSEQQRIIAIIEEQMSAVEQARAAAQTQLDAAEKLMQAYLREVFESEESQGWRRTQLGDICNFVGGSQPAKSVFKYQPQDGYVRLVQIQDFRRDDLAVYIPEKDARRFFDETDVMIGRYGPPIFQILRGLSGAYNVALMKAVPKNGLTKGFLFYLLKHPDIQNAVIAQSQRSAGQSGVDKEFLEKLEVIIPSVEAQTRIAKFLAAQLENTTDLTLHLKQQFEFIQLLSASLLLSAFEGKL